MTLYVPSLIKKALTYIEPAYITAFMQIITGFDSDFAEEKEKPDLSAEFMKVLDAIPHSLEVAENVFARVAKSLIRAQVDRQIQRVRLDEVIEGATQWFTESSVAISALSAERELDKGRVASILAEHVVTFGEHLLNVVKGDKVLVDSLSTKIFTSGMGIYQFRLKQKWATNG